LRFDPQQAVSRARKELRLGAGHRARCIVAQHDNIRYHRHMLNGNDVLVLVWLLAHPGSWTFRSLARDMEMDVAALHRRLGRLKSAKLVDSERQLNRTNVEEFLLHAVPYVIPGDLGAEGRGIPTAWGVEPLRSALAGSGPSPVWPSPHGTSRGPVLEPVSEAAVDLVSDDPEMSQWLGLVDAIRVGRARERKLASSELRRRIWGPDA
jgi:hypothetical protein